MVLLSKQFEKVTCCWQYICFIGYYELKVTWFMQRILLTVFLFLSLVTSAQNALRDDLNGVYYDPTLYAQQYEVESGSPYLELDFRPAKIGNGSKTHMVRFNGYKDNVEVWVGEKQVIILDVSKTTPIKILDGSQQMFVLRKYRHPKKGVTTGFLEVVHDSVTYSLFKKKTVRYFKKTKAEGYSPAKPARFEKGQIQFYLKPPNVELPIYLPTNKKRFLSIFGPESAARARATLKKQRFNLTKEEDLKRLLNSIYAH